MRKVTRQKPLALAAAFAVVALSPLQAAANSGEDPPAETPPKAVEFELGAFITKNYQPLQDVTTRLIFTAHASVSSDRSEEFNRKLQNRRNRVRDQVLVAARLTTMSELQDPDLRLLRRRILLRLRHSLPDLPIEEILLSEFQFFQD